jgi:crossover junction endodeoxyribonuclease RuvC
MSPKRILGIDPGTNILGFAILEIRGTSLHLVHMGVAKMSHFNEQAEKLRVIYEQTSAQIELHQPTALAIEAPFYGKNVQSMLKLGRAQGVAMAAAISHGLEITEYSPKKIKQSITGNGNASKEQVAAMLKTIISKDIDETYLDATDALATAVCHHFQMTSAFGNTGKTKDWKKFLANNPSRKWNP